jgi:hypothetical protein
MPGTCTSMLYCAVPFTFPGTSTRVASLPISLKRTVSSGSSAISGAFSGIVANAAISP